MSESDLFRANRRGRVLAVDDRRENLVALQAALEPLELDVICVESGEAALRALLSEPDIAVILLDVHMPVMDGFETAELIKQRDRTSHLPIIFLTAHDIDSVHEGYEIGAMDYLRKPLDAVLLRSKVQVLIELYDAHQRLATQARQLERVEQREQRREIEAAAQTSEARYEALAQAIPQIIWTAAPQGGMQYLNERWSEYTGQSVPDALRDGWASALHPDDVNMTDQQWRASFETGTPFDIEYRLRRFDGVYRWHIGRALPMRDASDHITGWVGTCTDIDDRKRTETIQQFLGESTTLLASQQPNDALDQVCTLATEHMVDWCGLFLVGEPMPPAAQQVFDAATSMRVTDMDLSLASAWALDDEQASDWAGSGHVSAICVPLVVRSLVLGCIMLVADLPRQLSADDMFWAEELASRVAATIDSAFLLRQAEERAQAAQVLDAVGDGVMLVDANSVIRLWNPAAAIITGLPAEDVLALPIDDVLVGWSSMSHGVTDIEATLDGTASRSYTITIEAGGRELWLSLTGVETSIGVVYAFRDLTSDRAVEKMKSDFIATISHELRTPLAAIYGAAGTIQRPDLELDEATHSQMLTLISDQSERLAQIVNDVLLASRLDSGLASGDLTAVDVAAVARRVIESAKLQAADNISLVLTGADKPVKATANAEHVQQILGNLVENAMKYSPDGGTVELTIDGGDQVVRINVRDEGIGIPVTARAHLFDKFYRLDADMTRGIGGTGLGLYICRELVRHMSGRIWLTSGPNDRGSIFHVELQVPRG